jgi:hypothetical protein
VIPLGQRADGTWVIACGKPATEELKKALEEILGAPVFLVATRPSAVFAALDHIREQEQKNWGRGFEGTSLNIEPFERLTPGEWESFTTAYYRGEILQSLLLKATGIVDPTALAPAGKEASVMDYLKSENIVDAELLNLMGGLGRVVGRMDWNERQEKRVPSIPVLLRETDYLTDDVLTWVVQEGQLQKISDKALLQNNFLASSSTLDKAGLLLDTLKSILGRNPV